MFWGSVAALLPPTGDSRWLSVSHKIAPYVDSSHINALQLTLCHMRSVQLTFMRSFGDMGMCRYSSNRGFS